MSRKRSQIVRGLEPPGADDLKLIYGIGPAVVTRLNGVGIFTFAQLAAMSPADLAAAVADLTGLTTERIIKQNWIGQAHELAEKSASHEQEWIEKSHKQVSTTPRLPKSEKGAEPLKDSQNNHIISVEPQIDAEVLAGRQNQTAFTIELSLDEDNNLRSTRIVHIQSGDEDTWTDWQGKRLLDFIAHRLEKNPAPDELTSPTLPVDEPTPPVITKPGLAGVLRLSDMEVVLGDTSGRHGILSSGQSFDMRLMLDLTEVTIPEEEPLQYSAIIYGKRLDSRIRQLMGKGHGTVRSADRVTVKVDCAAPSPGTYLLEADVTIAQPISESTNLNALTKGNLLHVH